MPGLQQTLNGKLPNLSILMIFAVPTILAIGSIFVSTYRIDANAREIEDNGTALSTIPQIFVPRTEIDAKLQTIQVQIGAMQNTQREIRDTQKEIRIQSARETSEILQELRRLEGPNP